MYYKYMNVVVVIPNWNGADFITEALSSLAAQTLKPHIIVVENGSVDESVDLIVQNFPKVELLEFADNAGFAGGVNRGIRPSLEAGADYIALFNNDAVADKDWLKNLVTAAEAQPEAGIITGKFMRLDKEYLDSTGDIYTIWGMPFPRGRNQKDTGQFDTPEYVMGATGGASLYRASMLKEIGLFDEDFFAYFEDVDISLRAQLAGWKVWYEPSAEAYHHVSGTSSKLGNFSRYHALKNFQYLWLKNLPLPLLILFLPLLFLQTLRLFLTTLVKNRSFTVFLRSQFSALRMLPRTLQKRRVIQKSRKVSTGYIFSILHKGLPPITKKIS